MSEKPLDTTGTTSTSQILKSSDGANLNIGDNEAEQRFGKKIQDLSDEELKQLIASNPELAEFLQKPNYKKSMDAAEEKEADEKNNSQHKDFDPNKTKGHQPDSANVFRPKRPG
ncbi:MAG: hypothetical protein A3C55_06365 [Gammaproteobacteria bacterium RIFCSPHIGHO2_02_FULL_42_13]|nr:MAG: hypothetical protein A3C55_06365 [Gammaproteobacteria bacterium RIFCSPHIGHO2_02_FULL_42_13]